MKTKIYNNIIDGTIEAAWVILWYFLMFFVVGTIISSVFGLVYWLYGPINYLSFIIFPTIIFTFPVTLVIFYIRKAQRVYQIRHFRDFWICFAVRVQNDDNMYKKSDERNAWLEENTTSLYVEYSGAHYFLSRDDAIQFKLTWFESDDE